MLFRTVLAVTLTGLMLGVIFEMAGCKPAVRGKPDQLQERTSIAPGCMATGQHCFALSVGFDSAAATGREDHVARLEFTAGDEAGESQPMQLLDPQRPQGTQVKFDSCSIDISPRVGEVAVASYNDKECRARTAYVFTVLSPDGKPVADFTIDESGNLTILTGSVNKPFDVQLISTHGRSIYMIFEVAEVTGKAVPLFAFEWSVGELRDQHTIKAADGWSYEFLGHHGTLGFFHATCLGTLPDDLTLVAQAEQGDRTAELKEWAQACGSTGGG